METPRKDFSHHVRLALDLAELRDTVFGENLLSKSRAWTAILKIKLCICLQTFFGSAGKVDGLVALRKSLSGMPF